MARMNLKKEDGTIGMSAVPERATISVAVKPLSPNDLMRSVRLKKGGGRSLLARDKLAVVESLRPRGTVHEGPPSCKNLTLVVRKCPSLIR